MAPEKVIPAAGATTYQTITRPTDHKDSEQTTDHTPPENKEQLDDELSYPTGIKLVAIGFGLCLAVLCSNLVKPLSHWLAPPFPTPCISTFKIWR